MHCAWKKKIKTKKIKNIYIIIIFTHVIQNITSEDEHYIVLSTITPALPTHPIKKKKKKNDR